MRQARDEQARAREEAEGERAKSAALASSVDELSARQAAWEERRASLEEATRSAQGELATRTLELQHEREQRQRLREDNDKWTASLKRISDSLAVKDGTIQRYEERLQQQEAQLVAERKQSALVQGEKEVRVHVHVRDAEAGRAQWPDASGSDSSCAPSRLSRPAPSHPPAVPFHRAWSVSSPRCAMRANEWWPTMSGASPTLSS